MSHVNCQPATLLRELGAAMSSCHAEHLLTHHLAARLVPDDNSDLSDSVQSLLNHLTPLLSADQRSVRLTAYHLLTKMVPRLTQLTSETVKQLFN